jgi:hypothetical protein
MKHGLGRVPSPKDSRDWPVERLADMIADGVAMPVSWSDPVVLDQGQTPHCVGYGCAGFVACAEADSPADITVTDALGDAIYAAAKIIDGEPGQQNGSSVRSGAKALKEFKYIDAYAFGTFAQGQAWVRAHGPVVVGTDWTEDMFDPDTNDEVHATGDVVGGHCWLWRGVDEEYGDSEGRNSWGTSWANAGDFYISDADFKLILANGGEVLMAVKYVKPVPVPPAPPAPTPAPPSDVQKIVKAVVKILGSVERALAKAVKELEELLP